MQKRNHGWLVAVLALTLAAMMGCSSEKYADINALMKAQTDAAEQYVSGLEKAENADDVAGVINTYTDNMKDLIPKVQEFWKKHPDLPSNPNEDGTPDEYKKEMKRFQEAMGKIQSATMKLMKYMMDPKVQQAFQRMGKEMGQLGRP